MVAMKSVAAIVVDRFQHYQELTLEFVNGMTDERLYWKPSAVAPSIAFHVWHIARWADRTQAVLANLTPELTERLGAGREIWEAEDLATAWGFDTSTLGHGRTGAGMDDDASAALPLPDREKLLDYVTRAFSQAAKAVESVDDELFVSPCSLPTAHGAIVETMVGNHVMNHLTHVCRHLGMIEALRGVQGERGSATM